MGTAAESPSGVEKGGHFQGPLVYTQSLIVKTREDTGAWEPWDPVGSKDLPAFHLRMHRDLEI